MCKCVLCVYLCVCGHVAIFLGEEEWLINYETLHVGPYVGYHDSHNVSNFGGNPVTQLKNLNVFKKITLFYGHGAP